MISTIVTKHRMGDMTRNHPLGMMRRYMLSGVTQGRYTCEYTHERAVQLLLPRLGLE